MLAEPLRVVLDANVLFPFTLRDTLLRAAALGLYQVYWSEEILDETTRNLIATGRMSDEQAVRLVAAMRRAFPDALVQGFGSRTPSMPNDEKDRHVVAAAVTVGATLVVTQNLKDFRIMPPSVSAQSPDEFLLALWAKTPDVLVELLHQQAASLRRPPVTFDGLLRALGKSAPRFEAAVREGLR